MAHRHVYGVVFTGRDIENPRGGGHYHLISGGERTSTEEDGPEHIHTVGSKKTSKPLPLKSDEEDSSEEAKIKKKKKRKKKSKSPKWNY